MNITNSYISNDEITLELPNSVALTILDSLADALKNVYKGKHAAFNKIILDFTKINYIEPEGALALICFCSAIKYKNPKMSFHFIYPQENVLNYLITLGFFGQMSIKVGAIEGQDIVYYEKELRQERILRQKRFSNNQKLNSIIMPIETIPKLTDNFSEFDFENMVGTFLNNAITILNELFIYSHFNLIDLDKKKFISSNRELYKNIFGHSKSWGIALIHARPYYGTTVCYYDIGIGFKGSVGKFNSDYESIKWALIDGNSSNIGFNNDGYGLTIVQDFVLKKNGKIKIRSGECFFEKNANSEHKYKVNRFPGVQMSFFIPCLKEF